MPNYQCERLEQVTVYTPIALSIFDEEMTEIRRRFDQLGIARATIRITTDDAGHLVLTGRVPSWDPFIRNEAETPK
jgi:hypothetical protein